MNKKLIAAAIAGAFVAPAAFAQNSTVQIYGLLNAEYGFLSQQNMGTGAVAPAVAGQGRASADGLNSGASRIGFRGQEKLGGGMSAFWQCESDLAFLSGSGGTGSLCGRNSAIGLKGGFGSFYIGTWDSPLKRVTGMTRITNETGWLGSQHLTVNNGGAWTGSFSNRNSNSINYDTPNFSGFSASAQITTTNAQIGNSTSTDLKGRKMSLSGQYVQGPMAIVLGYSTQDDNRSFGAGNGREDEAWAIGGTYTFGAVKVGLTYVDAEIESAAVPSVTTERKSWNLAADWSLGGPHKVRFGYANAGDAKTSAGGGANTGAKLIQVSYLHSLSKRTTAVLGYARINNDSAGTYSFAGVSQGAANIQAGDDGSVVMLGLNHSF